MDRPTARHAAKQYPHTGSNRGQVII